VDRVAVIVNGRARQVTEDLVEVLDQLVHSGDLYVSRDLEEADRIAETILDRGYRTVLTGGGDGTFVQMVTRIVRGARERGVPPPRFGLLKLGTGNALAWVLGSQSPKGKGIVADLGRLRTEGGSRSLRLLDVEGLLTPFAGLGVDATCLDHYARTKELLARRRLTRGLSSGAPAYLLAIVGRSLPEFVLRPHPHVRVVNEGAEAVLMGPGDKVAARFEPGAVLFDGPSRIVCMSTIPYWGFGARVFPFADEREDRFSLRVADITSTEVARHIRGLWRGTYRSPTIQDFLVERVSIHYEDDMPLQVGGDVVGRRRVVHAALSEAIRVVDYYAPPPV
jgi:diacylglycerol kinase family enzyme